MEEYRQSLEEKVASRTVELREAILVAQKMAERAEEGNRAKSEFLANVSHELRTPLNGVLGMLRLLLDGSLQRESREFAETACQSAEELLHRIDRVLDFARIEAGRIEIVARSFDPRELLDGVVALPALRARNQGLIFRREFADSLPDKLIGDSLRQILEQLLDNALRFSQAGEVVLSADWQAESKRLCLEVRDTGCGIPPARQAEMLAPFTQMDGSLARRAGGFGLGLAIARRLAEVMGGSLVLDSRPGAGTVVRLELPVDLVQTDTRPRVLILDQDRTSQTVLAGMLRNLGFRAVVTQNPADLLAHLQAAPAWALIVAVDWLERIGAEDTQKWRSLQPELRIVVLADDPLVRPGWDGTLLRPAESTAMAALLGRPLH